MLSLLVLLLALVWASWDMLFGELTYKSPPLRGNDDRPGFVISAPARLDAMDFEIRDESTTIDLSVSHWAPGAELGIVSTGEEIRILELEARSTTDEFIRASEWEATRSRTSDGGPAIGVRPLMSSPPTHVRLTLGTGQTTESGYYRFVRTSRIDVTSDGIDAEAADGVVSIETGEYTIERFVTGGVSRPGDSEGSTTRYALTSSLIPGANLSFLPVPEVSVDLVNIEKNRSRNSNLLILGAALGVIGGTLIEILLTAAHLVATRR